MPNMGNTGYELTKRNTHTDPQLLKRVLVPEFKLRIAIRLPPPNHQTFFLPTYSTYCIYPRPHFKIFDKQTFSEDSPPPDMPGPERRKPASSTQPPRPPNAWILYRSDKLREIPTLNPGGPRLPQADISKQISAMWKSESEEVRAQYEYLANLKKSEHQTLYPNYRFQPMKRADKERMREEKKAEKDRERETKKGKTRTDFTPLPPVGLPAIPAEHIDRYGPLGPSPPLSAAPSPGPASPMGSPTTRQLALDACPSTSKSASPHASAHSNSSEKQTNNLPEKPVTIHDSLFPPLPDTHPEKPAIFAPQPIAHIRPPSVSGWDVSDSQASAETTASTMWTESSTSQTLLEAETNSFDDYLSFTLPEGWNPDDAGGMFWLSDSMPAMLSGTADPNIYQLQARDQAALLEGPSPGEIEVSMPNVFAQYANGNLNTQLQQGEDFADFTSNLFSLDFEGVDFNWSGLGSDSNVTSPAMSTPDSKGMDNAALLSLSLGLLLQQQAQPNSHATVDSSSSLNLDTMSYPSMTLPTPPPTVSASADTPPYSSLTRPEHSGPEFPQEYPTPAGLALQTPEPSPPRPDPSQHSHSMPAPYAPPSGAGNASMRRAAASWKSFPVTRMTEEEDAPADEQRARQPSWGVKASS